MKITNQALTREDLFSLEEYSVKRNEFRATVMQHKKLRRLGIGEHANLYFEDRLTLQYQIQEMLRIERIFDAAGINEELEVYNPMIPGGRNLKATFMLEYGDIEVRKVRLQELNGIEDTIYLQVEGFAKVYPIANEDLERSNEEKTSAVHFMRFEFAEDMITALKSGVTLLAGIEHTSYPPMDITVPEEIRVALSKDFAD